MFVRILLLRSGQSGQVQQPIGQLTITGPPESQPQQAQPVDGQTPSSGQVPVGQQAADTQVDPEVEKTPPPKYTVEAEDELADEESDEAVQTNKKNLSGRNL